MMFFVITIMLTFSGGEQFTREYKLKSFNRVNWPIAWGIAPVSRLVDNRKYFNWVNWPIDSGIAPVS